MMSILAPYQTVLPALKCYGITVTVQLWRDWAGQARLEKISMINIYTHVAACLQFSGLMYVNTSISHCLVEHCCHTDTKRKRLV